MSLLEVKNVSKVFKEDSKENAVIRDISFSVEDEEFVCIVGPSGCGKSILLRIATGLEKPTSGSVLFQGQPVDEADPRISIVFQNFALLPWLDVRQNIELGLEAKGMPKEKREELVHKYIRMVGLEGTESAYPRELSGGMKQRVGIARALAMEPLMLCMDEPLSALDKLTATNLREELLLLLQSPNIPLKSVVMVTHNIEEAVYMADRIMILSKSPARSIAQLKVTLPRPRHTRSEEFLNYVDKVYSLIT